MVHLLTASISFSSALGNFCRSFIFRHHYSHLHSPFLATLAAEVRVATVAASAVARRVKETVASWSSSIWIFSRLKQQRCEPLARTMKRQMPTEAGVPSSPCSRRAKRPSWAHLTYRNQRTLFHALTRWVNVATTTIMNRWPIGRFEGRVVMPLCV